MNWLKPPSFIRDMNGNAVGCIGQHGFVRDTMGHSVGRLHSNNMLTDPGGRVVGRFERFGCDNAGPHFRTDAGMLRETRLGEVCRMFEPEPVKPYRYEPLAITPEPRYEPLGIIPEPRYEPKVDYIKPERYEPLYVEPKVDYIKPERQWFEPDYGQIVDSIFDDWKRRR